MRCNDGGRAAQARATGTLKRVWRGLTSQQIRPTRRHTGPGAEHMAAAPPPMLGLHIRGRGAGPRCTCAAAAACCRLGRRQVADAAARDCVRYRFAQRGFINGQTHLHTQSTRSRGCASICLGRSRLLCHHAPRVFYHLTGSSISSSRCGTRRGAGRPWPPAGPTEPTPALPHGTVGVMSGPEDGERRAHAVVAT
jgi:hypothetical protein